MPPLALMGRGVDPQRLAINPYNHHPQSGKMDPVFFSSLPDQRPLLLHLSVKPGVLLGKKKKKMLPRSALELTRRRDCRPDE